MYFESFLFDTHKTVKELVSRLGSDTALIQQATSQALLEVILGLVKLAVTIDSCFDFSGTCPRSHTQYRGLVSVVCLPW
jgi:hypothetical protein